MQQSSLAVVILNYNGKDFLSQFLPGVIAHSTPHRVVVADNCSTDDSVTYLRNNFPDVEVLPLTQNLGYSGGYNLALQQVQAKYYVLLNSDIEVTPSWIDPIYELMEANPSIAACQPKMRAYHQKEFFEYAGAAGGYIDRLGYPFCRGRIFDTLEQDQDQYNDTRQVFWSTGACLFVRAEPFHQVGGLDAHFFMHMEEIDLCWRLNHSGYECWYCGQSTVFHVGGGTLSAQNPKKTYLNFRNGLAMLYKNTPTAQLLWKLPLRLVLDGVAGLKLGISNGWGHCVAVIRAHLHFYRDWPINRKKRKQALTLKKENPNRGIVYKKLIAWQYFARNRKTFNSLNL